MAVESTTQPEGDRRTAKEYVHDRLRRQILTGVIRGGTHLVQTEIATEFEVSTTPVREALHDLASEGLVEFGPHRGAVVNQLNVNELLEVYGLRKVLEPMMLEYAIPHVTPPVALHLEELCDAMENTRDSTEWVALNRQFHGVFMDISGQPRLAAIVGALYDSASAFVALAVQFRPEMITVGNADHRTLAQAAASGDLERAVACAVEHMNITKSAVEGHVPTYGPGGSRS